MAAVHSSVHGVPKFRYLKGTVEWTVQLFNISPWHYDTYGRLYTKGAWNCESRWKVLFDIQGMEIRLNLIVNLQSAAGRHQICNILKLNFFDFQRPGWVKSRWGYSKSGFHDCWRVKLKLNSFFFSCAFSLYNLSPAALIKEILFNSKSCRIWRTYSTHKLLFWYRFVSYKAWKFSNATLFRKMSRVTAVPAIWCLNSCMPWILIGKFYTKIYAFSIVV